jgi:hypothetical protein
MSHSPSQSVAQAQGSDRTAYLSADRGFAGSGIRDMWALQARGGCRDAGMARPREMGPRASAMTRQREGCQEGEKRDATTAATPAQLRASSVGPDAAGTPDAYGATPF